MASQNKNILDSFSEGAKMGWNLAINVVLPNVLFVFAIVLILNETGIIAWIGKVFEPVMGIFGLPGAAAGGLILSIVSVIGGIGVIVSLAAQGVMTATQVGIVLPGIFLLGGFIVYTGRVLAPMGIKSKHYIYMYGLSVINACVGMLIMRLIVS